jgi:hypothetical protein
MDAFLHTTSAAPRACERAGGLSGQIYERESP